MRWGVEVWDRFDDVSNYVHKGVEFCERYEEFWKKRCSIENTYAKSLRKLIESYEPKKKDLDENQSTYLRCFMRMLGEIRDIAGQHELIAENVQENVLNRLNQFIKMIKEERRKCIEERDKYYAEHLAYDELLKKCKLKYEKAFREVEKAEDLLAKVENDDSASKNDIKKQKLVCDQKKRQMDVLEAEYGKQLCEANRVKNLYYYEQLPSVFDALENIEKKRIDQFRLFVNESVNNELEVLPRIKQCLNEIQTASESIDSNQDADLVVKYFKTGYLIPADHIFEDLKQINRQLNGSLNTNTTNNQNMTNTTTLSTNSNSSSSSMNGTNTNNNMPVQINTTSLTLQNSSSNNRQKKYQTLHRIKGLFTATASLTSSSTSSTSSTSSSSQLVYPKLDNETNLYDLPPQQLKNELNKKISLVQNEIEKQQKEREGLLKLKDIYSKNQKFGDSQSAEQALALNEEKLKNLSKQLDKYKDVLNQVDQQLQNNNQQQVLYYQYQSTSEYSSSGGSSSSGTLSRPNNNINNTHIYQSPSKTSVNSQSLPNTPLSIHQQHSSNNNNNNNTNTIINNNSTNAYAVSHINQLNSNLNVNGKKLAPLVNNNESFDDDEDEEDDDDDVNDDHEAYESPTVAFSNQKNSNIEYADTVQYDQVDQVVVNNLDDINDVIIGTALVMYAFEGNVQNSISIVENESLNVLEKDSGDGWTLVKKLNGERGYVPTDYVQIVYY